MPPPSPAAPASTSRSCRWTTNAWGGAQSLGKQVWAGAAGSGLFWQASEFGAAALTCWSMPPPSPAAPASRSCRWVTFEWGAAGKQGCVACWQNKWVLALQHCLCVLAKQVCVGAAALLMRAGNTSGCAVQHVSWGHSNTTSPAGPCHHRPLQHQHPGPVDGQQMHHWVSKCGMVLC